ncbi:glycosyl transferase family 1 [Geotalea uraniireducens]|uniref:Glycosyl transferase family 1 n=1 Tax=Geotalea uraniireducens TaxID=351604 RepID=A0ABM8EL48_9BACT|nr:glycosyltransferase family 4 protein [Geotalea uraniireducens]BDV43045.1 glycosyl transferase family 1 [Geotalea uraniireducens]
MKSLIIAHKYPLPENSGDRIRTMNFARYLSRVGRVDMLYFHPADDGVTADFPYGESIYVDKYAGSCGSRLVQLYEKLKYAKPWAVCGYTRDCLAAVAAVIAREDYDVILCRYAHHVYPLFFLPAEVRERVIVDIDDLISESLYETMQGTGAAKGGVKSWLDFKFYQAYQHKCAKLGRTLVCSAIDRQALERRSDPERLFLVPNVAPPVSLPEGYLRDGQRNLDTLLFVGNLEYRPNVQGIEWFITEIFSRLAAEKPSLSLLVAGRKPSPALRDLCARHERVTLVEDPPELVPLYERCGTVIVPLLAGGGTRIKILEAGLAHRPVISTPVGAHGLGVDEFEHLLYMRDYRTFAECYRWLGNPEHYRRLVAGMNDFVAANYSLETFNRSMDRVTGWRTL